jgi:hypothetical protein
MKLTLRGSLIENRIANNLTVTLLYQNPICWIVGFL